jgi:hypothetical protein
MIPKMNMRATATLIVISLAVSSVANDWTGCYRQTTELTMHYTDGRSAPSGEKSATYLQFEKNNRLNHFCKHLDDEKCTWKSSGVWFNEGTNLYYSIEYGERLYIGKLVGSPNKQGIENFKEIAGYLALSSSAKIERIPSYEFPFKLPEDEVTPRLKQLKDVVKNMPQEPSSGAPTKGLFLEAVQTAVTNRDVSAFMKLSYSQEGACGDVTREQRYLGYASILLNKKPEVKHYDDGNKHLEWILKNEEFPKGSSEIDVLIMNSTLLNYGKIGEAWYFLQSKRKKQQVAEKR